jgi:hypothetical protein
MNNKIYAKTSLFVAQDNLGKWRESETFSFLLNEGVSIDVYNLDKFCPMAIDIGDDSITDVMENFFKYLMNTCYSSDTKGDFEGERYQKLIAFKGKWAKIFQQIDTDYQKVLDNTFSLN